MASQYSQVSASNSNSNDGATQNADQSMVSSGPGSSTGVSAGCTSFQKYLLYFGVVLLPMFCLFAIFFAQHCAQVLANEEEGTVFWSPQLAGTVAMLGLLSQIMFVSVIVGFFLQKPLLERYGQAGVSHGKVVKRETVQIKDKTAYKIFIAYYANPTDTSTLHVKKFDVKEKDFMQDDYEMLVLPEIPSSAIRKSEFDDKRNPCSRRNIILGLFLVIAPVIWILAIKYTWSMQQYSTTDFWVKWGMGILFLSSWLPSLILGYLLVVHVNNRMLTGGVPIPTTSTWQPELLPRAGYVEDDPLPVEPKGDISDGVELRSVV